MKTEYVKNLRRLLGPLLLACSLAGASLPGLAPPALAQGAVSISLKDPATGGKVPAGGSIALVVTLTLAPEVKDGLAASMAGGEDAPSAKVTATGGTPFPETVSLEEALLQAIEATGQVPQSVKAPLTFKAGDQTGPASITVALVWKGRSMATRTLDLDVVEGDGAAPEPEPREPEPESDQPEPDEAAPESEPVAPEPEPVTGTQGEQIFDKIREYLRDLQLSPTKKVPDFDFAALPGWDTLNEKQQARLRQFVDVYITMVIVMSSTSPKKPGGQPGQAEPGSAAPGAAPSDQTQPETGPAPKPGAPLPAGPGAPPKPGAAAGGPVVPSQPGAAAGEPGIVLGVPAGPQPGQSPGGGAAARTGKTAYAVDESLVKVVEQYGENLEKSDPFKQQPPETQQKLLALRDKLRDVAQRSKAAGDAQTIDLWTLTAEQRRAVQDDDVRQLVQRRMLERQEVLDAVSEQEWRDKVGDAAYEVGHGVADAARSVRQKLREWVGSATSPEQEASQKFQQWRQQQMTDEAKKTYWDSGFLYGVEGAPFESKEQVAGQVSNWIEQNAGNPTMVHYSYYRQMYEVYVKRGEKPQMAHDMAMDRLQEEIEKRGAPTDGSDKTADAIALKWGPARLDKVPVYNRVFPGLNAEVAPPNLPLSGGD